MATQALGGQLPCADALIEPRKKNPRDGTKAQGHHEHLGDEANDGTEVLAIVADVVVPDGRRAYEACHG